MVPDLPLELYILIAVVLFTATAETVELIFIHNTTIALVGTHFLNPDTLHQVYQCYVVLIVTYAIVGAILKRP